MMPSYLGENERVRTLRRSESAVWAVARLENALEELRRCGHRSLERLANPPPVIDSRDAHVVQGLWTFCLLRDEPLLLFQMGAEPSDAVRWDDEAGAFVCWSDPSEALEPVGYLRSRVFLALEDELGRRSLHPPSGIVTRATEHEGSLAAATWPAPPPREE